MFQVNYPVTNEHCPLATEGWRTFNERVWNLKSEELSFKPRGEQGPALDVIVYRNKGGRFVLPPMNPHWHMRFTPTNTTAPYRIYRQWNESAKLMVSEMLATGTHGRLAFPPEITDIRDWLWAGFRSTPAYTILVDFPYGLEQADPSTRRHFKKSVKSGFTPRLARDPADVIPCLLGTEQRKKFEHHLSAADLKMGQDLMDPERFRLYVNYAPNGEPATARLIIMNKGGIAYDIAAGTQVKYLKSGATQHLIGYALMDLQQAGATAFNFSCANIESVSPAKLCWGGRLTSMHGIEGFDYIPVRRTVGSFVRLWKNRSKTRSAHEEGNKPVTSTNS